MKQVQHTYIFLQIREDSWRTRHFFACVQKPAPVRKLDLLQTNASMHHTVGVILIIYAAEQ